MRIITVAATVTPERTLSISLPPDVPEGDVDVIFVVGDEQVSQPIRVLGALRESEFFGMWHERADLAESPTAARVLRERAWNRSEP